MKCCIVLALVLHATGAAAQYTTVLRADRMLDVRAGEIIENPTILVEGQRIVSVNQPSPPADARVIDLGDMTLLPGLIDMHTHLHYDLEGDWIYRPVVEPPASNALRGVPAARRTLLAGFTTVRDVGASNGFADVALARAIEEGWVVGPRMVPAAHAISITGGHCEVTGFVPR